MTDVATQPTSVLSRVTLGENALGLPEGLSRDEWVEAGRPIHQAANASMWWIGDWLVYAATHFEAGGENRDEEALTLQCLDRVTSMSQSSLRSARSVAARFRPARRRAELSFGHHEAVVTLDNTEADALLAQAAAERSSVMDLRKAVRRRTTPAVDATEADPVDRASKARDRVAQLVDELEAALRKAGAGDVVLSHLPPMRAWLSQVAA